MSKFKIETEADPTEIVVECSNKDCDKKLVVRTTTDGNNDGLVELITGLDNWREIGICEGKYCCSRECEEKYREKK